jgi:hypothetical protein
MNHVLAYIGNLGGNFGHHPHPYREIAIFVVVMVIIGLVIRRFIEFDD